MGEGETSNSQLKFEFTGRAGEYFGIWFTNLALNIVTLGIYSPWAKVRSLRYLYNNTLLDKASFDYTADPKKILRGRIVAFAVFVLYGFITKLLPAANFPLLALLSLATPWLVVRSLVFQRHNTMYRNLRFGFKRNYSGAVQVFVGVSLLSVVTFGLAIPYAAYRKSKFLTENSFYGYHPFEFKAKAGEYYRAYAKAVAWTCLPILHLLGGILLLAILVAALASHVPDSFMDLIRMSQQNASSQSPLVIGLIAFGACLGIFVTIYVFINTLSAYTANIALGNTTVADVRLHSRVQPWPLVWIAVSNAVVTILSLGLMYPWARIRMLKYRLSRTRVTAPTGFSQFAGRRSGDAAATGEELADYFDIDIAL